MGSASDRPAAGAGRPSDGVFVFGPFEFDPGPGLLYRGEQEVLLPPRAAAALEVFLRRPGEVLSKEELLDAVWRDAFVGEDSLSQVLSVVRNALGDDPRSPTYIETKWKRGYRFVAAVTWVARERVSPTGPSAGGPKPDAGPGIGSRLGHYEILGNLGAGAMGVVYRARDTVLNRDVAIKMLPDAVLADTARVASLRREAELLALVSHPNIAHIYSLEEIGGITFPVLELVEGTTLGDRLQSGGMQVEQALEIARQVAAGLDAAHGHGIVHRDLKPANIKVTPKGQAKVLDFGLATSVSVDLYETGEEGSATRDIGLTGSHRGAIVGTVAYMSPEQVRGQQTDKRSDIWSFGCVLYEMLTGRKAFGHRAVGDTLEAILEKTPDWDALPKGTPPVVRSLVRRCLRKDPNQRLHDIADAGLEIEEALDELASGPEAVRGDGTVSASWRLRLPWALAAVATVAAVWSLVSRPAPAPAPLSRLLVEVQPDYHLTGGAPDEASSLGFQRPSRTAVAISPDGQQLVYAAATGGNRRLYLRDLGQLQAMAITGTDGASSPFFSPDGEWIGFQASGALKKVPRHGGEPRTIVADTLPLYGASWADSGIIVFAAGEVGGLFQVADSGGVPEPFTTPDAENGETAHRLPHVLPGGKAVVYTVISGLYAEDARVVVESLEPRRRTALVEQATDARFVPTGHLVFARHGTLMAAPFSLERLEVTGEPVRVVEDVMHASGAFATSIDTGAAQFSVSATGSLVYVAGGSYPEAPRTLVWVDRNGKAEALPLPSGGYSAPSVSPDGRQLAYVAGPRARRDVWVYDIPLGIPRRLTFDESSAGPVWSPDGKRLVFPADRGDGILNLFLTAADGSGGRERLTTGDRSQFVSTWSSRGVLMFVEGIHDLWSLSMEEERVPHPVLDTPFAEQWPAFSPDGEWLAYSSDETGQNEVYVRRYPGPGPATRVSTDGGRSPVWSRDGTELFYRSQGRMMAVPVWTGRSFTHERPSVLFEEASYLSASPTRAYDVAPDGRFVMVATAEPDPQRATRIRVVLNWFEDLKRLPAMR